MKGIITRAVLLGAAAAAGLGCYEYRDLVDPCYPERYEYAARKEVVGAYGPQINNGHVLDQTVWSYDFEPTTDKLTPGGREHLAYLARRRPQPDAVVYIQTAVDGVDVGYDPAAPDKMADGRQDLDAKRIVAVQKFLTAQTAGRHVDFQVLVHDPAEDGMSAIPAAIAVGKAYTTRPQGGLPTGGGGGGAVSGGGGAGGTR
jgi:hypothetical protein